MPDQIVRLGGRDRELFEMLTDSLHDIDTHLRCLVDMTKEALERQPKIGPKIAEEFIKTLVTPTVEMP